MDRRAFARGVALALLTIPCLADAQRTKPMFRIGIVLGGTLASRRSQLDAFREAMHELGYLEGQNVVFEIRAPEGEEDARFTEFAVELVRLNVDVLVVQATRPILAAKEVTTTIPIVMAPASDPVGAGLIASLARPGGNITGVSLLTEGLSGKRLQLLSELVPEISRAAIIWNPASLSNPPELAREEAAARALRIELLKLEVRRVDDLEQVFNSAANSRAGGLVILEDRFLVGLAQRITDLALTHRLPAIYSQTGFIEAGGLAVYAPDIKYLVRRSATYVDKILKGAKPGNTCLSSSRRSLN
jgi:putative ABC transport system substrate-binding protein